MRKADLPTRPTWVLGQEMKHQEARTLHPGPARCHGVHPVHQSHSHRCPSPLPSARLPLAGLTPDHDHAGRLPRRREAASLCPSESFICVLTPAEFHHTSSTGHGNSRTEVCFPPSHPQSGRWGRGGFGKVRSDGRGRKKKKVLSKSSPPKLPDLQATRARGSRLAGPCRTSGSKPGMETPAASAPGCCSGAPRGPLPRGLTNFGKWGGTQRSCEVGPGAEGAPPAAPGRPRSRVSRADAGGLGRASCPSGHRA